MAKVYVFDHPLIQHKLTYIRDKNTGTKEFRELVDEVATLMMFEITREMSLKEVMVETPVASAKAKVISGKKLAIIPILRAGNWNGGRNTKSYSSCKSRPCWSLS